MPESVSLGRTIRRFREERGISQESLAALARIDRTFVSEIERGLVNPSIDIVQRIATGLGLRLSDLILAYECEPKGSSGCSDTSS